MSKPVKHSDDDLREQVAEQIAFLRSSARAFDNGYGPEAKRLALAIRVLVHQSESCHALLKQLGVLDSMDFFDTAGAIDEQNLAPTHALTMISFSTEGAQYVPPLGDFCPSPGRGGWLPFDRWWRVPVIKDTAGSKFSRRSLVLAVAHTDGGAHVGEMKRAYERLSRSNSLGWVFSYEGQSRPLDNPVLPSVRQIAYEVERSLSPKFSGFTPSP